MIHTVRVGDGYLLKSKKSFTSDVAKMSTEWVAKNPSYDIACKWFAEQDTTAIFEYTAPDARIVLPYSTPELRLLHVRDNRDGRYWTREALRYHAAKLGIEVVDELVLDPDDRRYVDIKGYIERAKVAENIEGWVIQFLDGDMVKLKCDWYLKRHRAMTFLRERDIAQLALDEGLDDVKSMLVGDGVDISDILRIEKSVVDKMNYLMMNVAGVLHLDGGMDRKDFAIKHREDENFGLLMAAYTGKEPDYKSYFERNILKQKYGLRQLNLLNSSAEPD